MSKEFEIVSKINLDTDEAMSKWQKFKAEAKEMKDVDLKIKISNLDTVEKELKSLIKLSEQLSDVTSKSKVTSIGGDNLKEELKYLNECKVLYRTIEKLRQQQSKTTNDNSFKRMGEDITKLESQLDSLKGKITNSDVKLELFNFQQQHAQLVNFEKSLTSLSSKAEKLQKDFNSIDFKHVNTSALEGDINQVLSKIEQLQVMGRQGIDVTVDLNNALGEVERLKSVLMNFKELDSLKSKFASLEGEIADALGVEHVDKLRSEMAQLESSVMQVDGSFDRLSSGMKSSLSSASSSIKKMNSELKSASKFTSDFMGSFYAYSAGNVIGDGIVRGIRSIKDAYLEVDKAMTNVQKVADSVDINTSAKLDNIRNKGIEIAKSVGQSSADVLNAIADTVQAGVAKTLEGSMDIAKQAMMFANVGDLSQEMASSMVNTMIRGFNVDPVTKYKKEVNGVSQEVTGLTTSMDALNYASNNYGTSAEQLSNAIQNGGNVLGAYGVSLNDTIGLITAGVEVMGDGNKVGNGLI